MSSDQEEKLYYGEILYFIKHICLVDDIFMRVNWLENAEEDK